MIRFSGVGRDTLSGSRFWRGLQDLQDIMCSIHLVAPCPCAPSLRYVSLVSTMKARRLLRRLSNAAVAFRTCQAKLTSCTHPCFNVASMPKPAWTQRPLRRHGALQQPQAGPEQQVLPDAGCEMAFDRKAGHEPIANSWASSCINAIAKLRLLSWHGARCCSLVITLWQHSCLCSSQQPDASDHITNQPDAHHRTCVYIHPATDPASQMRILA